MGGDVYPAATRGGCKTVHRRWPASAAALLAHARPPSATLPSHDLLVGPPDHPRPVAEGSMNCQVAPGAGRRREPRCPAARASADPLAELLPDGPDAGVELLVLLAGSERRRGGPRGRRCRQQRTRLCHASRGPSRSASSLRSGLSSSRSFSSTTKACTITHGGRSHCQATGVK